MHNVSMTKVQTISWLIVFFGVLIWSAIAPKDYVTWALEVSPAAIALVVLALTFHAFPLTRIVYWSILVHAVILMVGGHYTYAEVPLFDWVAEALGQSRNNYDKVGHFAQGFVPVLVAREILIRQQVVDGAWWTHFLSVCFCLAFSAFYELIEWFVAELSEEAAEAFLGTQGYVWDTQSDMAWALGGAILGIVLLSRIHDRQISEVSNG
jgi:putative membrane protein